jgi:hypothetical protein
VLDRKVWTAMRREGHTNPSTAEISWFITYGFAARIKKTYARALDL